MTRISDLPAQKPAAITAFRNVLGIKDISDIQGRDTFLWSFLSEAQRTDVSSNAGTLDCSAALNAAIASKQQIGADGYSTTARVILPRGTIRLSATIDLRTSVHISGDGRGQSGGNNGTHLKFDNNIIGFIVHKSPSGSESVGADASILEGLLITGGGTDITKHGVDLRARAVLRDVTIRSFPGNGLNVVADVTTVPRTNANLWYAEFCSFNNNGLSGLYTAGGDANAGSATSCDVSGNGAWGILDSSFLGNTYIAIHADANGRKSMVHYDGNHYFCVDDTLGGSVTPGTNSAVWELYGPGGAMYYWPDYVPGGTYLKGGAYASTGLNARNLFLGCYSEQGSQTRSEFNGPCFVLSGLHAAGYKSTNGAQVFVDGITPTLRFAPTPNGANISVGAGSAQEANCVLSLSDPGGLPYRLKYATGSWFMDWGNLGGSSVLQFYNRDATPANGFARDMSTDMGGIGFPTGHYLGTQMIRTTCGPTKPADNTGAVGDRHINTNPTAGGWDGWRRIAAGGVWKGYGAIEA